AVWASGVDAAPLAHSVGTNDSPCSNECQSGIGVAAPTQYNCWTALGSPVCRVYESIDRVETTPRYSRTPPLSWPRHPNGMPLTLYCPKTGQLKPPIGITRTPPGTWSVRTPNSESTSALYSGRTPRRLPSSRTPYCTVGFDDGVVPIGTGPVSGVFGLYVSPR